MTETSDDELVERTAGGDKVAFTHLVARHQRRLLALVMRSLGNRAAAEDIVQDVFTKAWINAPSWQPRNASGASYAAWLSRVAVNLSIDHIRKRGPVARTVALEETDPIADPAPAADSSLVAREREARVRAAIAALPERQRLAIGLCYDADLTNAEGAAAMETSVGAFELLLVRARRALRHTLRDA